MKRREKNFSFFSYFSAVGIEIEVFLGKMIAPLYTYFVCYLGILIKILKVSISHTQGFFYRLCWYLFYLFGVAPFGGKNIGEKLYFYGKMNE